MTWLVTGLTLKPSGSDLESCMTVDSAHSVVLGAGASPGYCTPSRLSRQQVCRISPGMTDQDRRQEVSGRPELC